MFTKLNLVPKPLIKGAIVFGLPLDDIATHLTVCSGNPEVVISSFIDRTDNQFRLPFTHQRLWKFDRLQGADGERANAGFWKHL